VKTPRSPAFLYHARWRGEHELTPDVSSAGAT
jgi:hypothetical protein